MKIYKIADTSGNIIYMEANEVTTNYDAKIINFYSKGMLVGKMPLGRLAYMGTVDGIKDSYDKEEKLK